MVATPQLGLDHSRLRREAERPLTPAERLRRMVPLLGRVGVGLVVLGVVYVGWLYRAPLGNWGERQIATATGATVQKIVIEGAEHTPREALQQSLMLQRGQSLVAYNTASSRQRLEKLPWVRLAAVERQLPDTLKVSLYEHVPLARVEEDGQLWVVNKDGTEIVPDDGQFAQLPVLHGLGAPKQAASLFALLAEWPNLTAQLSEATWVGQRRWDLKFINGVVVRLPEQEPQVALKTLATLEQMRHVLTLNAGEVDLRLADRVVLRLPTMVGATPVTDSQGFKDPATPQPQQRQG